MAKKKYTVKECYKGLTVIAAAHPSRKDGTYRLDECTQIDLKYLHDVIRFEGVTEAEEADADVERA